MTRIKEYIPPTYMLQLKHQLKKHDRGDIQDRDRRLLRYVRELQMAKRRTWFNQLIQEVNLIFAKK